MPKEKPPALWRYGVAIVSVALACSVRLPVQSLLGNSTPFLTFFPAVLVSAVYGGFDAGLVATFLSGLIANYLFVTPYFSFSINNLSDLTNLILYFVIGGFISWLGGVRTQAAQERIRLLERELRTQKQLEKVRDQFFAVIENTSDGCYMLDRQWRYTYVNRKAAEIARKSISQLLGNRVWDVFPEAVFQKDYQEFHRAMHSSVPVQFENFYQPYNIWYETDVYPSDEGLLIFVRDVTERKLACEALAQSEERFRLAARAVAGIVYDWNVQTGEVYRSDGLYSLIGVHTDEVPKTQAWWTQRIHPEDLARTEPLLLCVLNGDASCYDFEYRVRHENGQWIYLWDRGYITRDENGQILRVVGSSTDITQRKLAEQERQLLLERERVARTEAEAANRIKDEFLAVVSHELRSPLNPILGWAKLLQRREFDNVTLKKALSTIERNAQLQAQLIEDLLDISRIVQGKLRLNMVPVHLPSTIYAALETVHLAAEAKNIDIQTKLDTTIAQVLGDFARLQQILWNLLSNAVKFTPPGGQIDLTLDTIGSYAQIVVSDTGKGIDPNFLPYVFDSFRQADSSISRKFGGLGLGLSIVRHLVELHGGTICAQSAGEGQGATFTVRLPLLQPSAIMSPTPTASSSTACASILPLASLSVLVVDDELDSLEFFSFVLEEFGASVKAVASAPVALQLLWDLKPDIVLSDLGMPEMDGYMFIQRLRAMETEKGVRHIPAIALTAYAQQINQQQALAAGFQWHIAKPVAPAQLLRAISHLVRSV